MNNKQIINEVLIALVISIFSAAIGSFLTGSFDYFVFYIGIGFVGIGSAKYHIWKRERDGNY